MNRTLAALALAGSVAAFTAAPAAATPNHTKPSICHPVEGKGETGNGWVLHNPDEASKHIDEATGAGKHTRKDGRTDVYADAAGHCPGFVVVTPTPTHSHTPEPTPTKTTTPTPEPTPTETSTPEPTPSATVTPGPTPTATVAPDPTPTVTTPAPEPSTPAASPSPSPTATTEPSPTVTASPTVQPTTSSTASPALLATTDPPKAAHRAELAWTGAETANFIALGVLLLIVGVGLVTWTRILKEGAHK